jgi:tetratricopeptide (TPR) repeat protein
VEAAPGLASRRTVAGVCLGLVAAAALVYAPVSRHDFLWCDDDSYVFENGTVRQGLTAAGLEWAFAAPHVANYHPLTWLSHMLDVELFGLEAGAHHLVNVALHALTAVVLFLALRALSGALWAPAAVAALFALHPLRVESVAWVAERKDVLSGLFFALTLLAWAGFARRPGPARYAAVFACLALGLLAKSMLVTLPCLLLLLDRWPLRRSAGWGRLVLEKLPLFALSAAAAALAVASQESARAMGDLATLPLAQRLANAALALVGYLGKTFWPAQLAIFYPHPALVGPDSFSPLAPRVLAAALLLVAITALAVWQRRRRPYLAVGWLWFTGMLVPVLGLVQVGEQSMADRYTYLPQIGLFVALAWGARDLARARPRLRRALAVATPAVLVALAAASAFQLRHWRDGRSVFSHALAVTERNYFAHNHLGRTLENTGDLEGAAEHYELAVLIRPSAGALSNLGSVLSKLGRQDEAVARLEQALRLDPRSADALNNLGVVYRALGKPALAISLYERALALEERAATHYNLGSALVAQGQVERGARHLERALELDPFHAEAANNLGVAYVELGRLEEGVAAYERALALAPGYGEAACNRALAFEKLGRGESGALYEEVLRGDPDCVPAHRYLGYRRFAAGDLAGALDHLELVLRRQPASADAHNDVGAVLARAGELPRARSQFEAALRLDPAHPDARRNLARLEAEARATAAAQAPR